VEFSPQVSKVALTDGSRQQRWQQTTEMAVEGMIMTMAEGMIMTAAEGMATTAVMRWMAEAVYWRGCWFISSVSEVRIM
jgi:hypothetical protein